MAGSFISWAGCAGLPTLRMAQQLNPLVTHEKLGYLGVQALVDDMAGVGPASSTMDWGQLAASNASACAPSEATVH